MTFKILLKIVHRSQIMEQWRKCRIGGVATNLLQTKIGKPHDIELRVALKL
jgi:hypothetical protein